jgi:O-antigen/teichoic acid export membrane protein
MLKIASITSFIRTLSLLGKFLLFIYLAKYLSTEDIGVYGLVSVLISYLLYILGFEFYMYSTREILNNKQNPLIYLKDQFIFHLIVYIISFPFISFLLMNLLPSKYILWFFILLYLEHISQEIYRILVTMQRPIYASWLMFFRTGSWVYIYLMLIISDASYRNIESLFIAWTFGIICSFILLVKFVNKKNLYIFFRYPTNWNWILNGFKVSLPFFFSIIAIKGIEYVDRFFIKIYVGNSMLGVYSFYTSFSNSVQTFIYSGIFMIILPKLIKSYQHGNEKEYENNLIKLIKWGTISSILLAFLAAIFMYPILIFINKQIYINYLAVYWLLLISVAINLIGQIFHFQLYIRKADNELLKSSVYGLIIIIFCNSILTYKFGILGASISSVIVSIFLFFYKYILLRKLTKT